VLPAVVLSVLIAVAFASVHPLMRWLMLGTKRETAWMRLALAAAVFFGVELLWCGAFGLVVGGILGGSCIVVAAGYVGAQAWGARRLTAWCKDLSQPGKREQSLACIEHDLDLRRRKAAQQPARYDAFTRWVLFVAPKLDAAGLRSAAIRALEKVDESELGPLMRARRSQALAAFLIRNDDRARAKSELARVPRPVYDPPWEDAVASLDALIVALEGDAQEAERRARLALERRGTPRYTWLAVLAHALAAQGLREEATAVLQQVRATHGNVGLAWVVRDRGAASAIAESLQAETGAPYR
jgi:hypothetical protein